MKCECCESEVHDSFIEEEKWSSANGNKGVRKVCVLCGFYLPIGFNDCYGSLEYGAWKEKKKKVIRRFWFDIAETCGEVPHFLPGFAAFSSRGI